MKLLVAAAVCAITVAMALGHGVLERPILADDQFYFYMAERCASGAPPHVAHLEVKTQLPTMISGAALAVGRRLGASDVHAGRAASVAAAAVAAWLAWMLAAELSTSAAAGLVAAAATFAIRGLFMEAAIGFQPKVFLVAFLLAAHLACARRRPLATGVLGACAFLCWQPGGLVLASCGLAMLLDRRAKWNSLLLAAAGAVAVMAAYEAWFWWQGALAAQLHQEWTLAFGASRKPIEWGPSIWFVMTESEGYQKTPHPLPTMFVGAAALMWLGALVRPRRALRTLRENPGVVAFWLAAHLAVAFTLFDHQAHPDMLLVQPYFSVACGVAFGWLALPLARLPYGSAVTVAAAAAFALWCQSLARLDVARSASIRTGLQAQYAMAHVVDLYRDHRGSVWVMGAVHLLGFEHAANWTPVGNVGRETADYDMRSYRPLRDGRMPEIIVAGRGLRPGAGAWLGKEYDDITPEPFARQHTRVFSRKAEFSDAPGGTPIPMRRASPPRRAAVVRPSALAAPEIADAEKSAAR